jgi:hypothetical protein
MQSKPVQQWMDRFFTTFRSVGLVFFYGSSFDVKMGLQLFYIMAMNTRERGHWTEQGGAELCMRSWFFQIFSNPVRSYSK